MPTAAATPAKEFFIRMITKDISLEDCILDLIDNSVDGARNAAGAPDASLDEYHVELTIREDEFVINDNCGGISLEDAQDYAFHFGRRKGVSHDIEGAIGIYGIGMKRAIFKIGKLITVRSSTGEASFVVNIDVDSWEQKDEWEFDLEPGEPWPDGPGTKIEINELNDGVGDEFGDEVFVDRLRAAISRDYSVFLQRGFSISVNDHPVEPMPFTLRRGGDFEPAKIRYTAGENDEITIEISAGMAGVPPDDPSAETRITDVERYGWYVLCNDRVVLAGDKSKRTVWGHERFPAWHPQYNGFLGIASFHSDDPAKLPWTTTKRDIDQTHPVYRKAVDRMKALTRTFVEYTNARKGDLETARSLEEKTVAEPVQTLAERPVMVVPKIVKAPRVQMATIQYRRPREEVRRVAAALGNRNMNYKDVGERTYEYFLEREVEE